jgi:transcriptional regulator with XRE-family HTH domain
MNTEQITPEILLQIRVKLNKTQAEMANALGISRSMYSQRECGIVSISKRFSATVCERFADVLHDVTVTSGNSTAPQQSNIHGDAVNVIGNTHSNVQITPPTPLPTPTQEESQDLAIVPAETLTEHIEVVQQNNELLKDIREDQEKELRLKKEQGRQLSEVLEFIQGMDEVMQRRVKEIIDERTRTIIAMTNHHIHTQAQVMITAIEGIINMVEADVTNPDLFLRQLRAVRSQLEKMADFK